MSEEGTSEEIDAMVSTIARSQQEGVDWIRLFPARTWSRAASSASIPPGEPRIRRALVTMLREIERAASRMARELEGEGRD